MRKRRSLVNSVQQQPPSQTKILPGPTQDCASELVHHGVNTLWNTLMSPFRVVRPPATMHNAFPTGDDILTRYRVIDLIWVLERDHGK